ncbi:MAG: twin-arginine translocase TatA/TatE family subunit [Gemmatimonadaceae bacterium]
MFGLGPTELFIGLVVVLLLFGAKRIPEIAGSFGKGIKEFKKNMNEVQREISTPAEQGSLPPAQERQGAPQKDAEGTEPKRLI